MDKDAAVWIMDLRSNPGGGSGATADTASLFLGQVGQLGRGPDAHHRLAVHRLVEGLVLFGGHIKGIGVADGFQDGVQGVQGQDLLAKREEMAYRTPKL